MEENLIKVECMLCKMAVQNLDFHLKINHNKSESQIKRLKEVGNGFTGFSIRTFDKEKDNKNGAGNSPSSGGHPSDEVRYMRKRPKTEPSNKIESAFNLEPYNVEMELKKQKVDSYMKKLVSPHEDLEKVPLPVSVKYEHEDDDGVTRIELELMLERDFEGYKCSADEASPLFPKALNLRRLQGVSVRERDKGVLRCSDCSEVIEYDVKFGKGKVEKLISKHKRMCGVTNRASEGPAYNVESISDSSNELTTDEYYNHHYGATCKHTKEAERLNCLEGLELCPKVVRRPKINESWPSIEPEEMEEGCLDDLDDLKINELEYDMAENVPNVREMVACEFCLDTYMDGEHAKLFHTLRRHFELILHEEKDETHHLCPLCWSPLVPPNSKLTWNSIVSHLTYGQCDVECRFKCPFCEFEFGPDAVPVGRTVAEEFKKHLQQHKMKQSRWTYIATPREYKKCPLCHRFVVSTRIDTHVREHSRPYRCEWCDTSLANLINVWLHIETVHPYKLVSYQCYHCAANQNRLEEESRRNFTRKKYRCSICNKAFYQPARLKMHENNKLCVRLDYCAICNKKFLRARNALNHMKKFHPSIPEESYFSEKLFHIVTKQNEEVSHQSMSLRPKKDFIKHVRKKHMKGIAKPSTQIKIEENGMTTYLHTCPMCPKVFKFVTEANRHLFDQHRDLIMSIPVEKYDYKCCICEITYPSYSLMKLHWRKTHPSTRRKYVCCNCDNEFINIRRLTIHLQDTLVDADHASTLQDIHVKRLILVKNNSKEKNERLVSGRRGSYNRRKISSICFVCLKDCSDENVKIHILSHFSSEFQTLIPKDKPLICPQCNTGKVWGQWITLARHLAFRHKRILEYVTETQLYVTPADKAVEDEQCGEKHNSNYHNISIETDGIVIGEGDSEGDIDTIPDLSVDGCHQNCMKNVENIQLSEDNGDAK